MAISWVARGVSRSTGDDITRFIEALTEEEATEIAGQEMLIESIQRETPAAPLSYASSRLEQPKPTQKNRPTEPAPKYLEARWISQILRVVTLLNLFGAGAGVVLMIGAQRYTETGERSYWTGVYLVASCLCSAFFAWSGAVLVSLLRSIAINTRPN
jgi:hypothetical protein